MVVCCGTGERTAGRAVPLATGPPLVLEGALFESMLPVVLSEVGPWLRPFAPAAVDLPLVVLEVWCAFTASWCCLSCRSRDGVD